MQICHENSDTDLAILIKLAGKEGAAINSQLLGELITSLLETNRAPLPQVPLELALYRLLEKSI